MIFRREITDPIKIQYIILYTLNEADRIVTHDQLTSLVLDKIDIPFTEFRIAIDNLEKIGHIRVFSPDDKQTYCELLPLGKEANSFFNKRIPYSIRTAIKDYIKPFFREEIIKRSVVGDLLPLNENEYMADLGVYDGDTPLMKICMYAGTRAYANSMIREFKKDPQLVYETVLELLGNEQEPPKSDEPQSLDD